MCIRDSIQAALKSRWLGVVFAAALIATYAGGFNMLASFNLIDSMSGYSFYGDPQTSLVPLVEGGLLAVLVAVCVLGGGDVYKRQRHLPVRQAAGPHPQQGDRLHLPGV